MQEEEYQQARLFAITIICNHCCLPHLHLAIRLPIALHILCVCALFNHIALFHYQSHSYHKVAQKKEKECMFHNRT